MPLTAALTRSYTRKDQQLDCSDLILELSLVGRGREVKPMGLLRQGALLKMVCGADAAHSLEVWRENHEEWLSEFLDLPHGVPTQDVCAPSAGVRRLCFSKQNYRESTARYLLRMAN
jgi:hypothetical protein